MLSDTECVMPEVVFCEDVVWALWVDESKIGPLVLKVDADMTEEPTED